MNKVLKQVLILVCLIAILVLPYFVFAQQDDMAGVLREVGDAGGYNRSTDQYTFSGIAGTVITAALSLLGVFFLGLMVYAGFNWMSARGEEEKINKAKDTITAAIIGLIIVIVAYALTYFIFEYLIVRSEALY